MAKRAAKRMDWYRAFPRDFQSSLNYRLMTPAQRGAYRDLLDACWINFPNVKFPFDEVKICEVCNIRSKEAWDAIMPTVIERFDIHDGYLHNARLLEELNDALTISEDGKIKSAARWDREKPGSPEPKVTEARTNANASAYASACPPANADGYTITEQNRTEQNTTEQVSVGDLLASMHNESRSENDSRLRRGQPGYFSRGQYPGTSPKAIFSWMAKAWAHLKGEAAYLRYPSKFPEAWEQLCDQKSADLLVPAFELWIVKNALHEKVDWPLQDFMKVAQQFMSQVIPLNEAKPRITKEQMEATQLKWKHDWCAANPGHDVIDGEIVKTAVAEVEPGPDALFGPEEPINLE